MKTDLKGLTFILLIIMSFIWGCSSPIDEPEDDDNQTDEEIEATSFELSYWVDMDLTGNHGRGYWVDVSAQAPNPVTSELHVKNACEKLRNTYGADKLYVIYHRQYEPEDAKKVFSYWIKYGKENGMEIVPAVVLQCYSATESMNFTDEEIKSFAKWSLENINNKYFAIYDVYTRDQSGSKQDNQLKMLKETTVNNLAMVGMQPGVKVNSNYTYVVQDTWGAECQGRTNELWENPVYYKGSNIYGRRLLEKWVNERIGDKMLTVWNLIPVAWDYDVDDPLSYTSPGDHQEKNDPPIPGRLELCQKYITKCYKHGLDDPLFGGYSCDLHILEGNSAGRGEAPSFYQSLVNNVEYNGDFAETMKEIGSIYKTLEKQKNN